MKKRYTAWGILMMIFGALGISLGVFVCVCLAICMSDAGVQEYTRMMMQMNFSMTKNELQVFLIGYFVIVGGFTLVQAFVQFHGAIRLMKKKAKGKGWFIAYGIESIMAAVVYVTLTVSSFSGLFMIQNMTTAQEAAGVSIVMVCMVFIFAILTVYKIITACLMFSKMGDVVIVKKETMKQSDTAIAETVASSEEKLVQQGEIVLLNGEYENHSFHVKEGETIVIGSDATVSNLTLHDEKVSKKHCTVTYHADSDMFYLTDVSETGTIINGVPVDSEITYSLPKGSIIILGDSVKLQTK